MQYNSGKESVKQIAEKQVQVSQPNKSHKLIWVAVIIIVVVVVVAVVLWIVLSENGGNGNGAGNGGDDGSYKFPAGATFEDKLKICLEKNLQIDECDILFSSKEALIVCEELESDQCFYKYGVEKRSPSVCDKIKNEELKNNCHNELDIYSSIGDNENEI